VATITKRGHQQWQAKIRKKGYKPVSKTFRTKARAERWARGIETEMESRVFQDRGKSDSTCFWELADRYLEEVLLKQRSINEAPYRLATLRAEFERQALSSILSRDVSAFRDKRLAIVSGASVRKEVLLLRRMLEKASKEWGYFLPHGNPVSRVSIPKEGPHRQRRLDSFEEEEILQIAKEYGGEMYSLIVLAIETAARRSELTRMKWDDVDLAKRTVLLRDTKNGEDRRVPLSIRACCTLRDMPRQLRGRVFMLRPSSVSQGFRRICRRAGVNDIRFHDLRHEATSRFFEQGLSIMEVACITGHKDSAMLSRYTHLRAEDLVPKLDAIAR